MKDLSDIAIAAVAALANGDKSRYEKLFRWACAIHADEEKVREEFLATLCRRAGQARKNQVHGLVSRLKQAAFNIKPASFTHDDVRQILRQAGAIGYIQPQRRKGKRFSMLAVTHG